MSSNIIDLSSPPATRRAEDEAQGAVPKKAKLTNGDSLQEPAVSATTTETRADGLTWRSVGVDARVGDADGDSEMMETKAIEDYTKRLPRDVLVKILEWTVEVQTQPARLKMIAEDIRRTGWPKDKDTTAGSNFAKARYAALLPMRKVCRLWYHTSTPWLFQHVDFRHCTTYTYTAHHQLDQALALTPLPLMSKVQEPVADAGAAPPSSSSDAAPTSSPEIVVEAEETPAQPVLPLGHLVQRYTAGACESCHVYLMSSLPLMPKLQDIQLYSPRHLRNQQLTSLVANVAGPNLRSLDHVYPSNTDDLHGRCESFLTLLNGSPNLSKFGVHGDGFNLSEAYTKRLMFILKLNATLKHRQTDALGVGLQHLYLGPGCSIPAAFLRGLKDCAPRLSTLHVKTGVKIISDTNAPLPFDLHAFVASWGSQLTALTLVGTEGFSTRGHLDEVLKLCPNLVSLHLRSDHITFTFFKSIQDLVVKHETGEAAPAPSSQKLRHSLEVLAIAVRLPAGETSSVAKGLTSSITILPSAFVPFANACLRIEARTRMPWPSDRGGARDVLERAALMCKSGKEADELPTGDSKTFSKWSGVSTLVGSQQPKIDGEDEIESDDD